MSVHDYSDAFDNAETREFEAVPLGTYQCIIDSVSFNVSDNGADYFAWQFKILSGEYKDGLIFKKVYFNKKADVEIKKMQMGFFKTDLSVCGIDVTQPKLLSRMKNDSDFLKPLLDVQVQIKVKKGKKYIGNDGTEKTSTNVYINRSANNNVVNDDDIPF